MGEALGIMSRMRNFIAVTLLIVATAVAVPLTISSVDLVTFDGAEGTTFSFKELNDPVMGGQSVGTFSVHEKYGVFNGTCKIVPSLKAPGFIKASTGGFFDKKHKFADVSSMLNGSVQLTVRSRFPEYQGFKFEFEAPGAPKGRFSAGSYKAGFKLDTSTASTDWQVVTVPFNTFSYDWSDYTGRCDSKDPDGTQHSCCSEKSEVCPTQESLAGIKNVAVWAEGVEGDVNLEILKISASA